MKTCSDAREMSDESIAAPLTLPMKISMSQKLDVYSSKNVWNVKYLSFYFVKSDEKNKFVLCILFFFNDRISILLSIIKVN